MDSYLIVNLNGKKSLLVSKGKYNLLYFKLSICLYKGKIFIFPFDVFISIRWMNCYVICLLSYSCHVIWEKTYVTDITAFSVFMFTNVQIILLLFVGMPDKKRWLIG